MHSDACNLALAEALSGLRPGVRLPENVFVGAWTNFLFLESDALFCGNFVWAIKEFLRIESANCACLVNLTRKENCIAEPTIYLDRETTNESYQEQLRTGGAASAWLYQMEDYACSSDKGAWYIYAEKVNDVAVIALRDIGASAQFHYALSYLGAASLTYLLRTSFPFTHLSADWRAGLIKNYRPSRGRNPR